MAGTERPVRVFIAIGSNVAPERHVCAGLARLAQRFGRLQRSRVYRNAAVGFEGEPFLNLAAGFLTAEPVAAVALALGEIERSCGRRRDDAGDSPRTLDLDLLLYGGCIIDSMRVPRDEILTRAYVLAPLAEIAGDVVHPRTGTRIAELWQAFDSSRHVLDEIDIDCGRWARPGSET